MNPSPPHVVTRTPVPRGIATTGPALLSYGFRPFFLGAGAFGLAIMALWITALNTGWALAGSYGAANWHAHEMLFGYASAVLAGFVMTAIPNWTGRLPISGLPLLALLLLWLAGRIAMLTPDTLGLGWSLAIEACFVPVLALAAGREIIAGRNWKNLKILAGLSALALANIAFHLFVVTQGAPLASARLAVAIYIVLISLVGGRIIPSFSRNWLVKAGRAPLPTPFGQFDIVAILALIAALGIWTLFPDHPLTALAALLAALLQAVRLARWQGIQTVREPILFILHVGFAFIPLGLLAVSCAALGWLSLPSALHVLTVGAIGTTTLAMMTRVGLGHTGRPVHASRLTLVAYFSLLLAALLRPFAEILPDDYHLVLMASGIGWMLAFGLFLVEYAPILLRRKAGH